MFIKNVVVPSADLKIEIGTDWRECDTVSCAVMFKFDLSDTIRLRPMLVYILCNRFKIFLV